MVDDNDLVYLRARYYHPGLGVFTGLDPVEGDVGQPMSLNRYMYVAGNVVNAVDPSGMIMESPGAWDYCYQEDPACNLKNSFSGCADCCVLKCGGREDPIRGAVFPSGGDYEEQLDCFEGCIDRNCEHLQSGSTFGPILPGIGILGVQGTAAGGIAGIGSKALKEAGKALPWILLGAQIFAAMTSGGEEKACDALLEGGCIREGRALTQVSEAQLIGCRPTAAVTLANIRADGPFPFLEDDGTFFNGEGCLPGPSDPTRINPTGHREYTVVTPNLSHRGARRIITFGSIDRQPQQYTNIYYTDNHYQTFVKVN